MSGPVSKISGGLFPRARNDLAFELLARAEIENDLTMRAELENLAAAFLRLAEQAERNAAFVVELELPNEKDSDSKSKR